MRLTVLHRPTGYIIDMLQPITTLNRQFTLRLADNNDLFVTRSRLRLGERAFCIAAPRAWNSLLILLSDVKSADTVKTFKKRLKTFLFSKHYFHNSVAILRFML